MAAVRAGPGPPRSARFSLTVLAPGAGTSCLVGPTPLARSQEGGGGSGSPPSSAPPAAEQGLAAGGAAPEASAQQQQQQAQPEQVPAAAPGGEGLSKVPLSAEDLSQEAAKKLLEVGSATTSYCAAYLPYESYQQPSLHTW